MTQSTQSTQSAQSAQSAQRIAVIGGGVAAHSALKSFLAARGDSTDGTDGTTVVDVFTRERHRPYRRPAVNKDVLIDGKQPGDIALPGAVFDGAPGVQVNLHLSSEVSAVDTTGRTLTVDGETHHWDQLVFATGAGSRRLDAPWLEGRAVHTIRVPEDSLALRESLGNLTGGNVVIVGGGVLGLEAAAAAATLLESTGSNSTVTVLETQDDICRRLLPPAAAAWLRDRHAAHGVDIRCGLDGDRVREAVEELDPAAVVVSVGLERDTTLAQDAGLDVGRGIVVDEFGRTSVPGVWAAGDCVEIRGRDSTVLPEDEGSARLLGTTVGTALAGKDVESFLLSPRKGWSRQYGLTVNLVGETGQPDRELVLRSDSSGDGDELAVLSLTPRQGGGAGDSVVTGVTTVGRSPLIRRAKNALGMDLADIDAEFFADGSLIPVTG